MMMLALFFAFLAVLVYPVGKLLEKTSAGGSETPNQRIHLLIARRETRAQVGFVQNIAQSITTYSQKIMARFGVKVGDDLRTRLQFVGIDSPSGTETFYVIQYLIPFLAMLAGTFTGSNSTLWSLGLGIAFYFAPKIWLKARIRSKKRKIRRALPDITDLLMICVDAGLGLDQAMLRVNQELAASNPEIQSEFGRVILEQQVGRPRLEAWKSLAARVDMTEVNLFVNMLLQSERFGTPVVRALRQFSSDLRTQRRQGAEEAAARAKIKIIFPLVLFIFPCLLIVLLAPALLGISDMLGSMQR